MATVFRKKNKENTRQKSQEISSKQTPQKQRKNQKLEEKNLPQEINGKIHQRQLSPLRNQPLKDYETSF